MRRLVVLGLLLGLAACGFGGADPTVIDGSSQEAFDRTLSAAKSELGPQDRLKFEAALAEHKARTFADADNRQEYGRLLRKSMDGLTAPRIVASFDKGVTRVKDDAADKAFDVKRTLTKGSTADSSGKDGQ